MSITIDYLFRGEDIPHKNKEFLIEIQNMPKKVSVR